MGLLLDLALRATTAAGADPANEPETLAPLPPASEARPDALSDPAAEARRQPGDPEVFDFSPPGDPANDAEAVAERAAIVAEANGWSDAVAFQEARWQADRERCWRAFLCNAERILAAPEGERSGLLTIYAAEASARYGKRTGADMAASLRGWINARAVH